MSQLALRNAVAALLLSAPACAQSLPELPTPAEFRRSLAEAAPPPPAETPEKTPPSMNLQPKPYSRMFRASEAFAWGGTVFDGVTTAKGISLGASEAGFYRVIGARNAAGILITGAAVEVGLTLLSRKVYREGHPKVATALNFFRGSVHAGAGAHNLGVIRDSR